MKIEWKSCLRMTACAFLLYLGVTYWPTAADMLSVLIGAAAPLLLGCVIAYVINILMSFYERHCFGRLSSAAVQKYSRPVCMVAAMLTLVAIVILIVWLIVPELVSCVRLLFSEVPTAIEKLVLWLDGREAVPEDVVNSLQGIDWRSKLEQAVAIVTSGATSAMGTVINAVSAVVSSVVTFFMGLIFAVYLLMGKEKLGGQAQRLMRRYMKPSLQERINHTLCVVNDSFHKYIVGQCTEAMILGGLCAVGMMILRLPYATMIGALVEQSRALTGAVARIGKTVKMEMTRICRRKTKKQAMR